MARPKNNNADYFPEWNPRQSTIQRFYSSNFRTRYKALRSSSSAFIQKPIVRELILKKTNGRCYLCNSKENIQIDHINSIYLSAKGLFPIEKLNSYENLNPICQKCNSGKIPDNNN